ncbi:biotin transporter BioY [Rickettsia endosymbiont of Cantharis rufa]|uniref:biotin transporter BioY n=1 Tax=Rickettsia endosymbiont of Cantharis rufa TaxID=3066248 RepID=UPI003132F57E
MQLNSISFSLFKQRTLEVFLGVALLAICSQITIPFKPIPVTLQTIAVLFIGLTYDKITAPLTMLCYIAIGVMGAPVMMNYSGGLAKLTGPTAGYLVGFPIAVHVMASLKSKAFTANKFLNQFILYLTGNAIVSGLGWLWLSKFLGLKEAFYSGILFFIVPGIIKSILLVGLVNIVKSKTR